MRSSSTTRGALPSNFIAQVIVGLWYPLKALRYISRHKLWPITLVAVLINVVLLGALLGLTLWLAVPLLHDLDTWLLSLTDAPWLEALLVAVSWIVWVLAVALIVAGNAIVLVMVGQAVAGPFLEMLSERIEAIELGTEPDAFTVGRTLRSIVFGLTDLVWALLFLAAINIPIFLIGLVTAVGTPVATVLSFAFTALLLAQEFMTMPLMRRMVSYRDRWRVVWSNKWLAFGFGITTMGIMLVPGLNLVLLPLAAAGGTLAYCDLEVSGRVDGQGRALRAA